LVVLAAPAKASESAPRYDPAQSEGQREVLDLRIQLPVGGGMGAHLVLQTAGDVQVHGVTSFLSDYGIVITRATSWNRGHQVTIQDMPPCWSADHEEREISFRDPRNPCGFLAGVIPKRL
jgi:hypothetical protein